MKQDSLRTILLNHINSQETWVSKGQLALVAENEGYLGESAGRVLRLLEEEGKIKVSFYKSKRNIDLARYARIGTAEPEKPKLKVEYVEKDGERVAVYNLPTTK